MDTQSPTTSDNLIDQLRAQLTTSQHHITQLQQEKVQMGADFEYKRSKIKELYFAKENVIREQNSKLLEAGQQISHLESTIAKLKEEIENVNMIAAISENTKEEAVKNLDKHHQEEIESLRCVLQDSMEEQRRDLVAQFEQERRHWEQEMLNLQQEHDEVKGSLTDTQALIQIRREEENSLKKQELEASMKKAQTETDTLKSVVVPLETEIKELYQKLEAAEIQLESERKNSEAATKNLVRPGREETRLTNGPEVSTREKSCSNATPVVVAEDNHPSDDDSFTPFQSHIHASQISSSTVNSASTMLSEYQDNISISSLPDVAGLIPDNVSRTQRVLSAPHLNLLASDEKSDRRKEPRAWDEVPPDRSESKESTPTSNEAKLQAQCTKLRDEVARLNKLLENERSMRRDIEEAVAQASGEAEKQIEDLSMKLNSLANKMEEEHLWRRSKETEDDKRLSLLQKDRDQIYKEFDRMKRENDFVKSSYERHRVDLSKEHLLPMSIDELRIQIHKYREALLGAQVERSLMESKLQSELGFLKDCLSAEQVAKEQIEKTFASELEQVRKELASMHDLHHKLEKETTEKRELQAKAEKDNLSMETIRLKSKEIIKGLKEKLTSETSAKVELESKLAATKNQVRSLQDSLETSEAVQQDFVKLSQSLQMQLEDIRLKEELEKKGLKMPTARNSVGGSRNFPNSSTHHPG